VYGIVEQSGGSIAVESQPGQGARFRVELPAAPEEPARQRSASGIAPAAGSETLLLTEDEASVRRFMRRVLDEQGYTVFEAANGAEALQLAARHPGPIDLLVSDVIMPELGGAELAQRLKRTHPETRVLYVSGYADDAIGQHGVLAEDASFLAKPFTSESLVRKVREVLDAAGRSDAGERGASEP
jgi:response regulator RpfG family c-di-GMP phosphodiesterase